MLNKAFYAAFAKETDSVELSVADLVKEYPTRSGPLRVLDGLSFSLAAGENMAIVGPSGCGKSTLLHILGGLDRPTRGEYVLNSIRPWQLNNDELATFRFRQVGFVFQDHHLLPQCSLLENVLLPTLAVGGAQPDNVKYARELLTKVSLENRLDHLPSELSGGERQRGAIARALINQPKLLLADEPTGNLDTTTAENIGELLLDIQKQTGTMLIVVTHSEALARRLMRRYTLCEGRIAQLT
jgi:lipoprotein-releasing system ATP-binding protein